MKPHERRRVRRGGLLVLATVALAAGAFLLGAHQSRPRGDVADDAAPGQGRVPAAPAGVAAAGDPAQSAIAWLVGYRSLAYTDPSPTSWIDRVAPVVTEPLASQYSHDRDATAGASWTSFVDQRCVSAVTQPTARLSPEAPRAPTEVFVDVDATVVTSCATGRPPGQADEHIATTLRLEQGTDRLWRVSARFF